MACDLFTPITSQDLLYGKCIYFFGGSNMRGLYKDLLWLLESGPLIPESSLKRKNEPSFANDKRVSNDVLHSGRNYVEVREYKENPFIKFQFITRLFTQEFIDTIMNVNHSPDFIIINSCLWDLSRWGANGVQQFKKNLKDTFDFLRIQLPNTRIIWLTALSPSFESEGGYLTNEVAFLRSLIPWHMLFANNYVSDVAKLFNVDILDIHYHTRFLLDYHAKDGIHWAPIAMRYMTNILLTHIALVTDYELPGNLQLNEKFLSKNIQEPKVETQAHTSFVNNALLNLCMNTREEIIQHNSNSNKCKRSRRNSRRGYYNNKRFRN